MTAPTGNVRVPVRVPNTLRELVGGERTVTVDVQLPDATETVSVASVLDALAVEHASPRAPGSG